MKTCTYSRSSSLLADELTTCFTSPNTTSYCELDIPTPINKVEIFKEIIKKALSTTSGSSSNITADNIVVKETEDPDSPDYVELGKVFKKLSKKKPIHEISKTIFMDIAVKELEINNDLQKILLYTYKWYYTEDELFKLLLRQFRTNYPLGLSPSEKRSFLETTLSKIQIKVLIFLKDWFRLYKHMLVGNLDLQEAFLDTLFNMVNYTETGNWVKNPVTQFLKELESTNTSGFEVKRGKGIKVTSIKELFVPLSIILGYSHILAKQLCLLDYENFKEIKASEFVKRAWTNTDKTVDAYGLSLIADFSNRLSRFVSFLILTNKQFMKRAMLYQYLVDLCDQLVNLNNFNSAIAIYLGLASNAVRRLEGSIKPYLSRKCKESLRKLENLFSVDNNLKTLKDRQDEAKGPTVPYVGVYLSELFFTEEAPDFNDAEKMMINLEKFKFISGRIDKIIAHREAYNFVREDEIINFLRDMPLISEEYIYDLSDKLVRSHVSI